MMELVSGVAGCAGCWALKWRREFWGQCWDELGILTGKGHGKKKGQGYSLGTQSMAFGCRSPSQNLQTQRILLKTPFLSSDHSVWCPSSPTATCPSFLARDSEGLTLEEPPHLSHCQALNHSLSPGPRFIVRSLEVVPALRRVQDIEGAGIPLSGAEFCAFHLREDD